MKDGENLAAFVFNIPIRVIYSRFIHFSEKLSSGKQTLDFLNIAECLTDCIFGMRGRYLLTYYLCTNL